MRFRGRIGKYRGEIIKSITCYEFVSKDFVLYTSYDEIKMMHVNQFAYWIGSVKCKNIPERVWRAFSEYVSSEFFEIDLRRVLGRNV